LLEHRQDPEEEAVLFDVPGDARNPSFVQDAVPFEIPGDARNPSIVDFAALLPNDNDGSISSKSSSFDSDSDSSNADADSDSDSNKSSSRARRRQLKKTSHLKTKKFRKRLRNKSMSCKSVEQETKALAATRADLGAVLIGHLRNEKECKTAQERCPMLALVAHHKRKDVVHAIDLFHISKHDWRLIKIHAMHPGPLKPVKRN
jgi:hypothetical protein